MTVRTDQMRFEEIESQVTRFRALLDVRGTEIDKLQVEQARRARPFYRDPAVIVSIVAILVSLAATGLSFATSEASQRQVSDSQLLGQRGSLTTALQKIADWRNLKGSDGQPASGLDVSGGRPALDEANFLIDALQGTPYQASAWENVEVAMGYLAANEAERGLELARRAEVDAQSSPLLADRVVTTRTVGQAAFEAARPEEGRVAFRREFAFLDTVQGHHVNVTSRYEFETIGIWINLELISNGCPQARDLVADATRVAGRFTPNQVPVYLAGAEGYRSIVRSTCG